MLTAEEQLFENLLNAWCKELLPAVKDWNLGVEHIPVCLNTNRQLSATVEGSADSPRIVIGKNLLTALSTCNRNLFNFGWKMMLEHDPLLPATDAFMHDMMALVFAMDPPGPPDEHFVSRITRDGYDDYRQDYASRAQDNLAQAGVAFLSQVAPPGADQSKTIEGLGNIAEHLNQQTTQLQLLECQVKFLILHELAHIALGHLCCETTEESELEADRLAVNVYLSASAELRQSGNIVIDSPALITLFSTIGYIEDMIRLVDQSILHGIPESMRDAFRPIARSHPCVRQRAARVVQGLSGDGLAHLVALMNEGAIGEVKHQFRRGVISTRVFKWYVRVRGLEMQAGYAVKLASDAAQDESIADKVRIERQWDSLDFQWGPLIDDIFPANWHNPVSQPEVGGT